MHDNIITPEILCAAETLTFKGSELIEKLEDKERTALRMILGPRISSGERYVDINTSSQKTPLPGKKEIFRTDQHLKTLKLSLKEVRPKRTEATNDYKARE